MRCRIFFLVALLSAASCATSVCGAEPGDSEKAVALAADWLAAHQLKDGGWSFDHRLAPGCDGKCPSHGEMVDARNAATSLAVLALMAAGQGEKGAKHSAELNGGLAFLALRLKDQDGGKRKTAEEAGGSMYSHGLATLALCEGYRLTGNMALRESVQKTLDHIVYAQDPVGGGWRYSPRQVGDTSASGWQISAIISGRGSILEIPADTFTKAAGFLEAMQSREGAMYGYTGPGAGQGTTAIGLLSRRRLGWKADQPAFVKGIEYLSKAGPSKTNLYYDFYATQAIRQADEESWQAWQAEIVPFLVGSQATEGHAAGSWHIPGDHGATHGGRVYGTSMATLILGVEHGKLPIFRK